MIRSNWLLPSTIQRLLKDGFHGLHPSAKRTTEVSHAGVCSTTLLQTKNLVTYGPHILVIEI